MHLLQSTLNRRMRRGCRPRVHQLEERALLSTLPSSIMSPDLADSSDETLGVVQMAPAPDSVLTQSPSTVTVTFNLPIDQFTLGFDDFGLDQVNSDGSLTPLDPTGALGLLTEVGVSNSSPNAVVLDINQALPAGQYEVMLLGSTMLAGLDASNNDVYWSPPNGFGADTPIAGFTIATPGVTVADATNLGTVGPTTVTTVGALDLGADPSAVSLYQFTLAAGQTWLVGAEIWASRINSPLQTTLSLFSDVNGQGELIKTAVLGAPDSPRDPYLFAGLQPGTYYLGVSGTGNVPGTADGYDPFAGTAGASTSSAGGTFLLNLAAVPQNGPTEVQKFTLDYADPQSATPTGFTLTFSRPIDSNTLAGIPFTGLGVVDQSGKVWGVMPAGVARDGTQVTFVFDQPLPAGQYAAVLPSTGGITDLAGFSPVASAEPAGVLARWAMGPSAPSSNPYDLGVVYPSVGANMDFGASLSPGQSVTYDVRLLDWTPVSLNAVSTGGPASIQLDGPNTHFFADGAGELAVSGGSSLALLSPGLYQITMTATGSESVSVAAILQTLAEQWALAPNNGVGQGPALNLLFATSGSAVVTGQTTSPGSGGATTAVVSTATGTTTVVTTSAAPSVTISAGPSAPAGLVVTIGGSLAGSLGSVTAPTTVSVASNGSAVEAQALVAAPPTQPIPTRVGNPTSTDVAADVAAEEADEVKVVAAADGALVPEVTPPPVSADTQVLADGEWIARLAERVRGWFTFVTPPVAEPVAPPATEPETVASPERLALQRDDLPAAETEQLERAGIGLPLGIGAISLVAVRLRQPVRRWWRARRAAQTAVSSHRGPHRTF